MARRLFLQNDNSPAALGCAVSGVELYSSFQNPGDLFVCYSPGDTQDREEPKIDFTRGQL